MCHLEFGILVLWAKLFLGVLSVGVIQFLTDNASVVSLQDLLWVRSFTDAVPPSEVSYKRVASQDVIDETEALANYVVALGAADMASESQPRLVAALGGPCFDSFPAYALTRTHVTFLRKTAIRARQLPMTWEMLNWTVAAPSCFCLDLSGLSVSVPSLVRTLAMPWHPFAGTASWKATVAIQSRRLSSTRRHKSLVDMLDIASVFVDGRSPPPRVPFHLIAGANLRPRVCGLRGGAPKGFGKLNLVGGCVEVESDSTSLGASSTSSSASSKPAAAGSRGYPVPISDSHCVETPKDSPEGRKRGVAMSLTKPGNMKVGAWQTKGGKFEFDISTSISLQAPLQNQWRRALAGILGHPGRNLGRLRECSRKTLEDLWRGPGMAVESERT